MEAREVGRLVTKATISALLQLLREDGGGLFLRQLHSRPTVACCLLRLLTAVVSPLIDVVSLLLKWILRLLWTRTSDHM